METANHSLNDDSIQAVKQENSVVRNIYLLLSATLFSSAVIAMLSAVFKLPHPGLILTLGATLDYFF